MLKVNTHGLLNSFLQTAVGSPFAPALIIQDRVWSYNELHGIAEKWATEIVQFVGRQPLRIGLIGQGKLMSYAGTIAATYVGAAFAPINARLPAERISIMIKEAALDLVLVDEQTASMRSAMVAAISFVPIVVACDENLRLYTVDGHAVLSAPCAAVPGNAAYILFTSGSTGKPKGVPITHANIRAFLQNCKSLFQFDATDRFGQTFDPSFDLWIFSTFLAWEVGAAVCPFEPIELIAPFDRISQLAVTVWFSVPSVARSLVRRNRLTANCMPSLKWSLFCGEALFQNEAESWQAAAPASRLVNLYGPTELTIACSSYLWRPSFSPRDCHRGRVPIGRLFPGLNAIVVDDALNEVPDNAIGELCISGEQCFGGYLSCDLPAPADYFIAKEDANHQRKIFYRTGDLVKRFDHDCFHFLGRFDQQVKINGYRVELGEIEAALRTLGWLDAAAFCYNSTERSVEIHAVVCGGGATDIDLAALRQRLPDYMMPTRVHIVNAMPLNPNGKTDRNALRAHLVEDQRKHSGPSLHFTTLLGN